MSDPLASVKETLGQVRGNLLKVPGPHPSYKEEYSTAVWALVDQIIESNENMKKVIETQNSNMHAVRTLLQHIRALPAPAAEDRVLSAPSDGTADGTDLKGE